MYQELKRCVFKSILKETILVAHLMRMYGMTFKHCQHNLSKFFDTTDLKADCIIVRFHCVFNVLQV